VKPQPNEPLAVGSVLLSVVGLLAIPAGLWHFAYHGNTAAYVLLWVLAVTLWPALICVAVRELRKESP